MKSFFIFCSGANADVLAQCPTDSTKYAGIGATIFFTAVLAGLSGGYALFAVFRSLWLALPFGLLWALIIFNLDRVIISSMRKQNSFRRDVLYAVPRFLLAALLAVVISKPLELKLFEREIRAEIAQRNNEAYHRTLATVDASYGALGELERKNRALQKEIQDKQKEQDGLYKEWIQEIEGTAGSLIPGRGPVAAEKAMRREEIERQLSALERRNNALIEQNQGEIQRLQTQREDQILKATRAQAQADGFLGQIEALAQLTRANGGARLASWFITLLFIALETAPVAVKLLSTLSPYRPYDQKLEDMEFEIVETSEQFRNRLRHKLSARTRKEASDVDGDLETEITLNSERNRQRLDTELGANKVLLHRIASAQMEVAEHIIEKWKEAELGKEPGAEEYVNVS